MTCSSCRHWKSADGAMGRCTLNPVWVATQAAHYCGQEQARGDVVADRVKLWDDVPLPPDDPPVANLVGWASADSVLAAGEEPGPAPVAEYPLPRPSARAAARRRRQGGDQ